MSPQPTSWLEYFAMIETKPSMYLGKESIIRLCFEIQGIRFAEDLYAIPEEKRLAGFSFEEFEKWVNEKYNVEKLGIQSYTLAQYTVSDHPESFFEPVDDMVQDSPKALALWFTWYHEYLGSRL